jgi:hypothetical protein
MQQAEDAGRCISYDFKGFSCLQCENSSQGRIRPWETEDCIPPGPWRGPRSHIPHQASIGETTICTRCGEYSRRGNRSYKRACPEPTATGRLVLNLAVGFRAPYGVVRTRQRKLRQRAAMGRFEHSL